jgi:hypothetical protein
MGVLGTQQPLSFTEVSDGVTFTFQALARIAGDLRFTGIAGAASDVTGIRVGGASSSLTQFTVGASQAVTLQTYVIGGGPNTIAALDAASVPLSLGVFDGLGSGGRALSLSNPLSPVGTTGTWNLALAANQTVTFAVLGGGQGGTSTSLTSIASFGFQKTTITPPPPPPPPPSPVPLPATALLLPEGLAGLAALRRYRR